jgi:CRP/FNR family transcriptional regulator, putaive post-exponential-phase nitrogen-starvation regulator
MCHMVNKMQKIAFNEKFIDTLRSFGIENINRKDLSLIKYDKGEIVCLENHLLGRFLICVSGHGRSYVNQRNGKAHILNIFKKDYVIGDYELIMNFATMTTVIADTELMCISIPLNEYRDYLLSNNDFMRKVSEILAQKLYASLQHSVASRSMPLEYRLCIHLLKVSNNGLFNYRMTDTADMLGVSYRHLLRTISNLTNMGIMTKSTTGYAVDIKRLNKHIEKL